jgi:hypothetical protein
MRKIISKKTEGKKNRIKQIVVGVLLVFIMVLSTVGYSLNSWGKEETKRVLYNGVEFILENDLWNAKIGNFNFLFLYNPTETEKIDSELKYVNEYANLPLYIYSEDSDATMEVYKNLFYYNNIVERVQEACPLNESCSSEIPVKNCTNNFIIIRESEKKEIKQEENCVFIFDKKEELAKTTDSFLFNILGIQ